MYRHWGGVNPDQLSSEARELYRTSGNSLYGVNRISSSVCPNFRLIHQNLDCQWQQCWMRRHQSIDTHSSMRTGPSVAAGFTLTGKDMILHELLCVTCLCRDWVSEWLTEVSCNRDPGRSQSDTLQLPDGPELKSTVSLKSFVPLNWSLCSDKKGRKSAVALTLCTFQPGGDLLKANRFAAEDWYPSSSQR